jgi:ectoine hydroxylase-related dioxygenase (phytanoyl-CoA dioxygenase family)
VPHQSWHFDVPADPSNGECVGVQVFAYLDEVAPGGGGTVVVAGSHRLASRLAAEGGGSELRRSADLRRLLERADPWFRTLFARDGCEDRVSFFMRERADTPGRVAELAADAGDVVLMDLRLLHAAAPNCGTTPRLMVAQHVYRSS